MFIISWTMGSTQKYINEVKPGDMGKIQFANELAWLLRDVMYS